MPAQPLPRARRRNPLAALPLAAIHGTAAQGQPADRPVVSSKIDTESALVGNVIRLALGQAGLRSTARLSLGPTRIVRTALIAGEIDLHPEYSGNAAFFRNRADGPAWRDAARAFAWAAAPHPGRGGMATRLAAGAGRAADRAGPGGGSRGGGRAGARHAADLVVFGLHGLEQAGAWDKVAALVFCAPGRVALSAINGRVVVRDGRLLTLDEHAHAAVHREAVRRLAG